MSAKIKLLPTRNYSAMVSSAAIALKDAGRRIKERKYTKVLILMSDEEGILDYECAGIDDDGRIALLEKIKHLIIRDLYGKCL